MNTKRFVLAWLGAFIAIFAFEWVFHGMFMKETYQATASLWRPEAEMRSLFHFMIIGQALTAGVFTLIFTKGYENKGIAEGIRYGFLVGLLFAGPNLIMHAVAPYPINMVAYWILGEIVKFILAGVVVALLYRSKRA